MKGRSINITLLFFLLLSSTSAFAQDFVPIWPKNHIPNSKHLKLKDSIANERIYRVMLPGMYAFFPGKQENKGAAVIICPGGGYERLAYIISGTQLAKWFNTMGLTAFVLNYRLPNSPDLIQRELGPLQDAQRAIRYVRANAAQWGIDPAKIGIMGSSAGGHLAALSGTFTDDVSMAKDSIDKVPFTPNFMILVSPVVDLSTSIAHATSRKNYLGPDATDDLAKKYSPQLLVTAATPPCFIADAVNDPVVNPMNSLLFYQALLQNKISASFHAFPQGKHAIAVRNNPGSTALWTSLCEMWLNEMGIIKDIIPEKNKTQLPTMNINIKKNICLALLLGAYGLTATAQQKEYSWTNLPKIAQPVFKKDTVNILKYGAKPDGLTLKTKSINAAIAACSAKGGGVVLIPQGLWLTGPIVLKSNVNLHVSRAALLQFTNDKNQYSLVEGNYEGHPSPRNQSPISGTNLVNIGITGDGIIDGAGGVWRAIGKERLSEAEWKMLVASGGMVSDNGKTWYPSASYVKGMNEKDGTYLKPGKSLKDYEDMKDFFRPNMVVLTNCKKVLLQSVTVQNSPAWCLHPLLCEDLTVRNVRVRNPWNAQNGDAIDVESCRNVLLEGNTFDAGDDGICIKSGRDEEGRKRGKPTENVIARNNVVYRAHGGFVIGSEMSGGAKNIFVTDCTFIGTDIGLRFKTTRGRGGVVEKIYVKNISMKDIIGSAILFDMYYGGKSVLDGEGNKVANTKTYTADVTTPQFKDFYVSNVVCNGASSGLLIRGLPELAIKGIHLENVVLKTTRGAEISEASNITFKNVYLECTDTKPVVTIENSSNIKLDGLKYTNNADVLFSIIGDRSKDISVTNTDASKAKEKATFKAGADAKAITIK